METITILCNTHKLGDIELYDNSAFLDVPSETYKIAELRAIAAALTGAADKLEQKDGAWVKGETTIVVARPAAKPRFKVGDRVKIKTTGVNAVVTGFGSYGYYEVKPPSGNALYMHSDDLEPAPAPDAGPEAKPVDIAEWDAQFRLYAKLNAARPIDPIKLAKDAATWDAQFRLYAKLNAARPIDPIKLAKDAAQYATAAVDARRKMEQQP